MKRRKNLFQFFSLLLIAGITVTTRSQPADLPPGGPPPFGPPGFGPGAPGGMGQEVKLVKQFDKNGDKRLNAAERKAARDFLSKQRAGRGPDGPGRRGERFGPRGLREESARPGPRVSPADIKTFPNQPIYDGQTLRTFFLEFEDVDWETELADFKNTDVEVPAKLTVDGRVFADVGVHFRGASSFMMVGEGRKRSLNLSLDWVHEKQNLGGYRTFNLLNSHEDPSFLRTVLYCDIARTYLPTPQANFVQVVINGESWGVYVSAQQFNKDFIQDWFKTTKGARWKVPGSPQGRGGLNYLGEETAPYKRIYEIKSKDEQDVWTDFIKLCRRLDDTPTGQLEKALESVLDIDGALRFLALENVFVNADGYWVRASDYSIYQDTNGCFHVFPHDANETFSSGGGPGGPGGPPGPGGPGRFGPERILATQLMEQADLNRDDQLTKPEFATLAEAWFEKLDSGRSSKISRAQFMEHFDELIPPPEGFRPPGGERLGPAGRGFGPGQFLAPALFAALDVNKDGELVRGEFSDTFSRWFGEWDIEYRGALEERNLSEGLAQVLPRPRFQGPGGMGGRPGRGDASGGVQLDPLVGINDSSKPLRSKLLAVPSLRSRYLVYVREIAEKWLDWSRLGPMAFKYQALIADAVTADTRKLDSTQAFFDGFTNSTVSVTRFRGPISLKSFADQRRAFLLNHPQVKNAGRSGD